MRNRGGLQGGTWWRAVRPASRRRATAWRCQTAGRALGRDRLSPARTGPGHGMRGTGSPVVLALHTSFFDVARCALSAAGGRHIQGHSAIRHWWWGRGCRPGVAALREVIILRTFSPRAARPAQQNRGITPILTAPEAVGRLKGAWDDHFSRSAAESVIQSVIGMPGSGPAGAAAGSCGPVSSRNVNVPSQHQRTFLPSFWG